MSRPEAVDIIIRSEHGILGPSVHVSGIEIGPVHVVGGQDVELIFTVLGPAAGRGNDSCQGKKD